MKIKAESNLVKILTGLEGSLQEEAIRRVAKVGAYLHGKVIEKISKGIAPPLKPATIARKDSSTPLIDTGQMVKDTTYAFPILDRGLSVEVGVFGNERAGIAVFHEYGAPGANIPERSFLRSTAEEERVRMEYIMKG